MDLQNGYKVIYEAKDRVTTQSPEYLFGAKSLPVSTDSKLVGYKNWDEAVDMYAYKVVCSDGKKLIGRTSAGVEEIFVVKNSTGEVVLGEPELANLEIICPEHTSELVGVQYWAEEDTAPIGASLVVQFKLEEGHSYTAGNQIIKVNGVEKVATVSGQVASIDNIDVTEDLVIEFVPHIN